MLISIELHWKPFSLLLLIECINSKMFPIKIDCQKAINEHCVITREQTTDNQQHIYLIFSNFIVIFHFIIKFAIWYKHFNEFHCLIILFLRNSIELCVFSLIRCEFIFWNIFTFLNGLHNFNWNKWFSESNILF